MNSKVSTAVNPLRGAGPGPGGDWDRPHRRRCREPVTLCEQLAKRLDAEGPVIDGQRGPKINPLLAELRHQRTVAAALTKALGIPPRPPGADA